MKFMKLCLPLVAAAFIARPATAQNDCNKACLEDVARQYLRAILTQDYSNLPWADVVRHTENNVAMMIGDGYWGAGPGVRDGFMVADAETGNVVWLGIATEHGQAAYHGLRLKIENRKITEVESYLGREGTPELFAPSDDYAVDEIFAKILPADQRRTRQRLTSIVNDYLSTKQKNTGRMLVDFTDDCARITNGVDVTHGDYRAADIAHGCEEQLREGIYKPVDRIRARRFPVVNEPTGIVVALTIEDHAARYVTYQSNSGVSLKVDVEYPNSRGMLEIFKVIDGKIARIEGVSVFLPYYIHDLWAE